MTSELTTWSERLEHAIAGVDGCCVDRVMVLDETPSTQDAARRYAGDRPGLLTVAGCQPGGRGRLGREWHDGGGQSLSATFAIDTGAMEPPRLAGSAGLAAMRACIDLLPRAPRARAGIKWPNDVVLQGDEHLRKIAGVLVERKDGLTLIGFGVNVHQSEDDWTEKFADRCVSLNQLGAGVDRLDVCVQLVRSLSVWLRAKPEQIQQEWAARDALSGRSMTFVHDKKLVRGRVVGVDPLSAIELDTPEGRVRLPVETTQISAWG